MVGRFMSKIFYPKRQVWQPGQGTDREFDQQSKSARCPFHPSSHSESGLVYGSLYGAQSQFVQDTTQPFHWHQSFA
jgi:hypothetical protein